MDFSQSVRLGFNFYPYTSILLSLCVSKNCHDIVYVFLAFLNQTNVKRKQKICCSVKEDYVLYPF